MAPKGKRRETSRSSAKCVGAQYVASLDGSAAGGLVEMPRVGATMLFARVDENGRISLVRTGVLVGFESHSRIRSEDPFVDSSSVETSAPLLNDLETPRKVEIATPRNVDIRMLADEDYDGSERTVRIPALRSQDYANVILDDADQTNELGAELATAEYQSTAYAYGPESIPAPSSVPSSRRSVESAPRRPTMPSPSPDPRVSPAPRGILPRRSDRSEPKIRTASAKWRRERERGPRLVERAGTAHRTHRGLRRPAVPTRAPATRGLKQAAETSPKPHHCQGPRTMVARAR